MKKLFHSIVLILLFFSTTSLFSSTRKLSDKAEISLITCGPGSELYTAFGHSAFRVKDSKIGLDLMYNYGTFDFNRPDFYTNFAKGDLLYFLSTPDTGRFLRIYHHEKRWVKAQKLNLSPDEVQMVFDFLQENAKYENREYYYDYFFNNCSTKLNDVIKKVLGTQIIYPDEIQQTHITHRQLMQQYLGNYPWGDFGIDLCLGAVIDREVTPNELLFLPENVFLYFDKLKITRNDSIMPLVSNTETILPTQEVETINETVIFTPFILFIIICIIVFGITKRNIQTGKRSKWLDLVLYLVTGAIGIVLSSIWFGTNHISARYNFNILWAFAPNILVSFIALKNNLPKWFKKYNLIVLILILITVILWIFKVQVFNIGVLPILILLAYRYYYLWKKA